ncbi:MAG TPA: hypothetical protein VHH34_20795 [Pseudonocardiaceae bacterium]|nr:hypothetical protein [Pseudonocardiaceae bacterium]
MSFDVLDHDAARRLWLIGLDIARHTDHPHADDLSTYLLYDMAASASPESSAGGAAPGAHRRERRHRLAPGVTVDPRLAGEHQSPGARRSE